MHRIPMMTPADFSQPPLGATPLAPSGKIAAHRPTYLKEFTRNFGLDWCSCIIYYVQVCKEVRLCTMALYASIIMLTELLMIAMVIHVL